MKLHPAKPLVFLACALLALCTAARSAALCAAGERAGQRPRR